MKTANNAVSLLAAIAFFAASVPTGAAVIYDSGQSGNSVSSNIGNAGKAVGFVMGLDSYTLDSVVFRLTTEATLPTAAEMAFGIYTGTSTGPSSTLAVALTDPTLTASTTDSYTLTPTSAFTLQASTTYWVVAYGSGTVNRLIWKGDGGSAITSGGVTQTSQVAKFSQGANTVSDPGTWNGNSGSANDATINATLVPEPTSLALLGLGSLLLLFGRRRRA